MELSTSKQTSYRKVGGWKELNVLGAGGFGTVTLWQNEESGEYIALKRCQVEKDINTKQRRRWEMEVDIMKRLDHPNVIVAKDVPPPLDVSKDVMPLLAMEYCSGGDLRKVLSRPENCCGLPEPQVRSLAQDIASAIEYLHSKRIIHRDLKPENIVLQPDGETIVYKLIDLGYAKELDQGSVCTSFVGTLQYLAPELFSSQRYSCTVDYWSFGTVVFECITGIRPFLPSFSPVRWHSEVIQKSDNHICASVDSTGAVKFSEKLPTPNRLCRTLQVCFEQWLRLVLQWNPTTRGGKLDENRRPECFRLLQDLLGLKIANVLDVSSNQLKSYPLRPQDRVRNLMVLISNDIKVPEENLELLLPSGIHPDPDKYVVQQCCGKPGEEDHMMFLFRVGLEKGETRAKPFPPLVQNIVKEPRTLLPYMEQRRAWAEAVHFCQEQAADLRALVLGQRAAMINLLRKNSSFFQNQKKMIKDYEQFCAKVEFFKTSLEHDQMKYKEQEVSGGITSECMFNKWNEASEEAKQFSERAKVASVLVDKSRALHTKIVELNKSPFNKPKQTQVLNDLTDQAQKLFQELRATPKEKRSAVSDHSRMVRVVHKCVMVGHKAMDDLYTYLGQVSACKQDLDDLSPQIQDVSSEIQSAVIKLTNYQKKRQNDIWQLLKKALSGVSGGCPGVGMLQQELKGEITTPAPQPLLESSAFESVQIIGDNRKTQTELSNLFSSMALDQEDLIQESRLNWDFIKDL